MTEILIDCDGLLADLVGGTATAMGVPGWVPVPAWDFLSNLPPEEKKRALSIWKRPGFVRSLPVIRGSQRGVAQLRDEAPVRVVTAMEEPGQAERLEWLWALYRIDEAQVTFDEDKSWVPGLVFMDDRRRHVEAWSRVQRRRAILFGAPHNAGDPWPHRAEDWVEAPRMLIRAARAARDLGEGFSAGDSRDRSDPMTQLASKPRRGFAAMDPEKQRQIASQGGKAAHRSGNAHEFTSAEAREAGRKGGLASRRAAGAKG